MRSILSIAAFCLAVFLAAPATAADADEDVPPPWEGLYCNEERCLAITNLEEGPSGGLFFDFAVTTVDGKKIGEAPAMVDDREAGYNSLTFTLRDDDAAVIVSADPDYWTAYDDKGFVASLAWLAECAGTYTRK